MDRNEKKALSLYIHIPFCIRKCIYCDFLSEPISDDMHEKEKKYVNALCSELLSYKNISEDYIINTIYIGGGTPSVLSKDSIVIIMDAIRKVFFIAEDAEISIEANPGTLDAAKLQTYRACGINRLSMGLQSAHDDELIRLSRIHNYDQFVAGYEMAEQAGFTNINVDIMTGIPGQSLHSYLETLECVLRLSPAHISSYGLILEEGTPIYNDSSLLGMLPEEDEERKMYHATKKILEASGYHRYEISNYARKQYECRHNKVYWTLKEYLGVGCGASSFFKGKRFSNTRDMDIYLDRFSGVGKAYEIRVQEEDASVSRLMEEYMFLGLRMMQGVSAEEFYNHFGRSVYDVYGCVIRKYEDMGMLSDNGGIITLTEKGIDVSNVILADFLL